jgi:hypothetical protein
LDFKSTGNFTLQTSPCSFLILRLSPWEVLIPFLLPLPYLFPGVPFLLSPPGSASFPCLFFSSPHATKSSEQHSTQGAAQARRMARAGVAATGGAAAAGRRGGCGRRGSRARGRGAVAAHAERGRPRRAAGGTVRAAGGAELGRAREPAARVAVWRAAGARRRGPGGPSGAQALERAGSRRAGAEHGFKRRRRAARGAWGPSSGRRP